MIFADSSSNWAHTIDSSGSGSSAPSGLFERCVETLIKHIADAHYRVALAAFESLDALIKSYPATTTPFLERLLPTVLLKMGDNKEAIQSAAKQVVATVQELVAHDTLVQVILLFLSLFFLRV